MSVTHVKNHYLTMGGTRENGVSRLIGRGRIGERVQDVGLGSRQGLCDEGGGQISTMTSTTHISSKKFVKSGRDSDQTPTLLFPTHISPKWSGGEKDT